MPINMNEINYLKDTTTKLTQEEIHSPLKKKNNIGEFTLRDFSTYYKAALFKVV